MKTRENELKPIPNYAKIEDCEPYVTYSEQQIFNEIVTNDCMIFLG